MPEAGPHISTAPLPAAALRPSPAPPRLPGPWRPRLCGRLCARLFPRISVAPLAIAPSASRHRPLVSSPRWPPHTRTQPLVDAIRGEGGGGPPLCLGGAPLSTRRDVPCPLPNAAPHSEIRRRRRRRRRRHPVLEGAARPGRAATRFRPSGRRRARPAAPATPPTTLPRPRPLSIPSRIAPAAAAAAAGAAGAGGCVGRGRRRRRRWKLVRRGRGDDIERQRSWGGVVDGG